MISTRKPSSSEEDPWVDEGNTRLYYQQWGEQVFDSCFFFLCVRGHSQLPPDHLAHLWTLWTVHWTVHRLYCRWVTTQCHPRGNVLLCFKQFNVKHHVLNGTSFVTSYCTLCLSGYSEVLFKLISVISSNSVWSNIIWCFHNWFCMSAVSLLKSVHEMDSKQPGIFYWFPRNLHF